MATSPSLPVTPQTFGITATQPKPRPTYGNDAFSAEQGMQRFTPERTLGPYQKTPDPSGSTAANNGYPIYPTYGDDALSGTDYRGPADMQPSPYPGSPDPTWANWATQGIIGSQTGANPIQTLSAPAAPTATGGPGSVQSFTGGYGQSGIPSVSERGVIGGVAAYNPTQLANPEKWAITPEQTMAWQVEQLSKSTSPLVAKARADARSQAAGRGLTNSAMAETAGAKAAYDQILPIAKQDAETYAQAAGYNVDMLNQFSKANFEASNRALEFAAEAANAAARQNSAVLGALEKTRMETETERYGYDKDFEGKVYQSDSQERTGKYTADRNLEGTKYDADSRLTGTRYTADKNLEGTRYDADSRLSGVRYTADKNYDASIYGSNVTRYGYDRQADAQITSANISAAANMYGSDMSAMASMYGDDAQSQSRITQQASANEAEMWNNVLDYTRQIQADPNVGDKEEKINTAWNQYFTARDAQRGYGNLGPYVRTG